MKTAAKVFIILSMIAGCILIYPLILGSIALKKLKTATSAEELRVIGILVLLFMSLLGGIFMLFIKDEDLADNAPAPKAEAPAPVEEAPAEEPKEE